VRRQDDVIELEEGIFGIGRLPLEDIERRSSYPFSIRALVSAAWSIVLPLPVFTKKAPRLHGPDLFLSYEVPGLCVKR
jgi:hypothetical protein